MTHFVCQFSCGAASAVATKLIIQDHGHCADFRISIVNAFIEEEHPDNRRFLRDCEKWFGIEIIVLQDEKYGASTLGVWKKKRYITGPRGAPCTKALKRDVLDALRGPHDTMVLGFTVEEQDRFDRFLDANPDTHVIAPLISRGLTKQDCFGLIAKAGIELPMMYRLGYKNANCVGCCKGGEGYWNKIRVDFPDRFEEVAAIQDMIGPGSFFFRNRKTGERISLRELNPTAGRYSTENSIECGVLCELVEFDNQPVKSDEAAK